MEEIYLHCNMHGCDAQIRKGARVTYDAETDEVYHNILHAEFEINHIRRQKGERVLIGPEISGRLLEVTQDEAKILIRQKLEARVKGVETQKPETD